MPTTTVKIYEVPNSYVDSGTSPTISGVFTMVVVDGDTRLHDSEWSDPGSSQIITVDGGAVSSYQFYYDDQITINGGPETIKTFQLVIGGVTRSFVMNDDGPNIPGATVGTSFTLDSYSNYTSILYADIACFVKGTLIRTATGQRPVETLAIGDMVETLDNGLQPIRWIGRSDLSVRELLVRPHLRPIRIRANSFGPGLPIRDLAVSPQHRIMVDGWRLQLHLGLDQALAPAKALVGHDGISVDEDCADVSYFHFMFDRHEVVISEGLPSESFLFGDTIRDGMDLAQSREILELFPDLAALAPEADRVAARPILKRYEVAALIGNAA
ncbi:MAG: Hint domain-containing protein [Rhodobacteraceae bacterium]|nr:Hint domain-containing protein [Paracoccaceae bacterium]